MPLETLAPWLLLAIPLAIPAGWLIVTVLAWIWDLLWNL